MPTEMNVTPKDGIMRRNIYIEYLLGKLLGEYHIHNMPSSGVTVEIRGDLFSVRFGRLCKENPSSYRE